MDVLHEHWALMAGGLQQIYRAHWLKHNQHCVDFIHPIVGGWVLELAIVNDDMAAEEFLIDRMVSESRRVDDCIAVEQMYFQIKITF